MTAHIRLAAFILARIAWGVLIAPGVARADAVTDWNTIANRTAGLVTPPPLAVFARQTRALAITHAAVFDAVNSIDHVYATYAVEDSAPGASPDAAAAQAAHDVLVGLYPAQQTVLDTEFAISLAAVPDGQSKTDGIAVGARVAAAMLALRAHDGTPTTNFDLAYVAANSDPGTYQLTPPNFAPAVNVAWANVAPFVLLNNQQFFSPGPYDLSSAAYVADFDEAKAMGSAVAGSGGRTADQEAAVAFWIENPNYTWNRIARIVSAEHGLGVAENARLFALLNIAGADAIVEGFVVKYAYAYWRPITAIRAADTGNAAAVGDPSWQPFVSALPASFGANRFTPAHPDYVSNHSIYSGAAATVLASFFGTDSDPFSIESSTGALAGHGARSYTSFSGAALECSLSRIHAGIHFRKAVFDGLDQGSHVGKWIFQHALGAGPGFSHPSRGGPVHGQVEDASEATHSDGIDE